MSIIDISSMNKILAQNQFNDQFFKILDSFLRNPAMEWMMSPFNWSTAMFVVAVTIKTESLNGFPIAFQNAYKKI